MKSHTVKQDALDAIQRLPDDTSMEEIMYQLYVLENIRHGQRDAAEGRVQSAEEVLKDALDCRPTELRNELRLAAAVEWYRQGRISQEVAAEIAGLDRTDFLLMLSRSGQDSFNVDFEDLDRELTRD